MAVHNIEPQDKIGLLETEELGLFFGIWKSLLNERHLGIPERTRPAKIRQVGLMCFKPILTRRL